MAREVHNKTQKEISQEQRKEDWDAELENYDDFDAGNVEDPELSGELELSDRLPHTDPLLYSDPLRNNKAAAALNAKNLALSADLQAPEVQQQFTQLVQKLVQQGKTDEQIRQAVQDQLGVTVTDADVVFAKQGWKAATDSGYNAKFLNSSKALTTATKTYTSLPTYLDKYFQDQTSTNDARDTVRKMKKSEKEMKLRMSVIMFQIMSGQITDAMRSYALLLNADLKSMARVVMDRLDKTRQSRALLIRAMARSKPPMTYVGNSAISSARANDQAQKYTQEVQVRSQLMGELQNTERELVDFLNTMQQDMNNFWQSYAGMRDEDMRTTQKVISFR